MFERESYRTDVEILNSSITDIAEKTEEKAENIEKKHHKGHSNMC